MKKLATCLIGGIAGATALNILHQAAKYLDHNAPHVDLVGEEALSKGLKSISIKPPAGNALFGATLASDLISNAAYFGLIGNAKRKNLMTVGAVAGLAAGIGAISLTKNMGLSDAPITKTDKTKVMTVLWYTFGGLVTGAVMRGLRK